MKKIVTGLELGKYKLGDPYDHYIRDVPHKYIQASLELLKENNGKIIVEIGSMRQPVNHPLEEENHFCCMDGHSSLMFALYAKKNNCEFWTVDISQESHRITKDTFTKYDCNNNSDTILGDGISYLKHFPEKIDLLYLDAWDVHLLDSCEKHLEAYEVAKDKLHDKSIILIDDTDVELESSGNIVFADGLSGKGKLVIPAAEKDGYKVLISGRQTLLSK